MQALHFTADIESLNETVFALIADLTQYDRWLTRSRAFGAVMQVAHTPVGPVNLLSQCPPLRQITRGRSEPLKW
jgi:hypothetical protein